MILAFCSINLRRETGGFELTSIITLVLPANRLTKCASQNNWFLFKETPVYKRRVCRSTKFKWVQNSYARWCYESFFFCICHWSKWYQKQRIFNQLVIKATFWVRYFFRVFTDIYFLEKSSLFVLEIATTFFNLHELQRSSEKLLHNIWPCFNIVFARLGVIPRARNRFAEVVAAAERYLIITHVKNVQSNKQSFRICLPIIICLKLIKEYQ